MVCAPLASAQTDVEYVKNQYPEVYIDIYENAVFKFRNNEALQEKNIQEQVYSFLQLAENMNKVDDAAMTDALLRWSRDGQEANNRAVIEDLSIENPFLHLRCDWIMVKTHYDRARGNFDGVSKARTNQKQQVSDIEFSRPAHKQRECENCKTKNRTSVNKTADGFDQFASVKGRTIKQDRVEKEERCTASGDCVVCKSSKTNKISRDYCSHLTSEYIQLLNSRYNQTSSDKDVEPVRRPIRYSHTRNNLDQLSENDEPQISVIDVIGHDEDAPAEQPTFQRKRAYVVKSGKDNDNAKPKRKRVRNFNVD